MRKAAIACFAVLDYTKQRILVECSQVVEEEKTDMIFGEKTEEQKRVAELTREVKELRKELLASKLDKKQVEVQMKELKDALELGGNLRQGYVDSQEHMAVARRGLINMMEDMNEIPIDDVKRDLDRLNGHLVRFSMSAVSGRMIRILSPQPTDSKIWRQIWIRSI